MIGFAALRVDGMPLAISTFALGVAAVGFLYRMDIFGAGTGDSVAFPRGTLLGLDLSRERTYYYVLLAVLALVVALLSRLRRTGPGRRMIAVRDNPDAAAAATIRPTRTKIVAFALSGALAGLGGGLLAGAVQSVPVTERFFQVGDSLMLVAIVVIGGLGSVWGPVLGAVWVIGLPAFFPGQRAGAVVRLQPRAAGPADVLPRRARADRARAARRGAGSRGTAPWPPRKPGRPRCRSPRACLPRPPPSAGHVPDSPRGSRWWRSAT
ncbi:ABC transporter permease subunit [Yinghuangia aomiensis]